MQGVFAIFPHFVFIAYSCARKVFLGLGARVSLFVIDGLIRVPYAHDPVFSLHACCVYVCDLFVM